jgi:hypothetical protein
MFQGRLNQADCGQDQQFNDDDDNAGFSVSVPVVEVFHYYFHKFGLSTWNIRLVPGIGKGEKVRFGVDI